MQMDFKTIQATKLVYLEVLRREMSREEFGFGYILLKSGRTYTLHQIGEVFRENGSATIEDLSGLFLKLSIERGDDHGTKTVLIPIQNIDAIEFFEDWRKIKEKKEREAVKQEGE